MTVDNSQVIVLKANAAPVTTPFDSERGQRTAEESNACYFDKIAEQGQKPALQQQEQQQHSQGLPGLNKGQGGEEERRSTVPASTNNNHPNSADVGAAPPADNCNAAAQQQLQEHQQHQPQAAPKWVRIGDKVCFSTVVAAVLIPSSHDLTPSTKRELWWQPADYADFRVNYATHMHNPSIEREEEEREEAGPAPAVPAAANADAPAATATVEGVLVVAASPAPAPLTSRSPNPAEAVAGGRRNVSNGSGGGGGSHKVGNGTGGGGAAAPNQDRVSKSKASRYDKSTRSRSSVAGPNQQQQYKNAPGRHRVGGGPGYKSPPPPHHLSGYMAHSQQFHGMQQQQQQQAVMMMQAQPGSGHTAGFGRRNARHDPYLAPRGGGNSNIMNNGRYQHHNGRGGGNIVRHAQQQQQQQFFVNGNPAGVNCPPRQQSRMGAGAAFRGNNGNGAVVEAFLPRHGGVAMAPASAPAFSSHVGGGVGGVVPRSAAGAVGGGHMTAPYQVGHSSQFSMWRSQVVFAPVMQMQ